MKRSNLHLFVTFTCFKSDIFLKGTEKKTCAISPIHCRLACEHRPECGPPASLRKTAELERMLVKGGRNGFLSVGRVCSLRTETGRFLTLEDT
jgi:hypothetical protein